MGCKCSTEEHDYRKRDSQWPKHTPLGFMHSKRLPYHLELRNCENGGTMSRKIWGDYAEEKSK